MGEKALHEFHYRLLETMMLAPLSVTATLTSPDGVRAQAVALQVAITNGDEVAITNAFNKTMLATHKLTHAMHDDLHALSGIDQDREFRDFEKSPAVNDLEFYSLKPSKASGSTGAGAAGPPDGRHN